MAMEPCSSFPVDHALDSKRAATGEAGRRRPTRLLLAWVATSLGLGGQASVVDATGSCPNLGNSGQCVRLLSDGDWRVWSTGIPTDPVVTRPASSGPWGSVIPGTPAQWVYARSFETGPTRDPGQTTVRRFQRVWGGTPRYLVSRALVSITADNGYVLYVNGRPVGATYDVTYRRYLPSADWRRYQTYDVTAALTGQGPNTITVDVYDYGVAAGFLLDAEIWCRRGTTCSID
jgi:hypothetical protein